MDFFFFAALQNKPHRYALLVNKEPFIAAQPRLKEKLSCTASRLLEQVSVGDAVLHVKGNIADWLPIHRWRFYAQNTNEWLSVGKQLAS